ncbi:MAG: ATP-binding protein [Candidatus Cloacimonetes bacterium]|nr:ATP-binding protein [Candidatus Cloacimonadota bacterium]MCF7813503.1 ATP-binding protein [Candidatus Cloacimonadota bacterium]MCF7868574.1 ATP-binding protein [Candidatus Cloacimonadota bacterium]MCF7883362.1 ATP-binding protein [Candidatus Cloacimonadota bacterium]
MYVQRELENKLKKYLKSPEIIAILGARQVGKTTLLQNFFNTENSLMISFEDREKLSHFQEDEKSFADYYLDKCDILIIDEFQYAREGGKKLKYIFDNYPGKKIIISGSSSLELTEQAAKYLVGRIFQFQLNSFSFSEVLRHEDIQLYEQLYKAADQLKEFTQIKDYKLPIVPSALISKALQILDEYIIFGGYPRVVLSENAEEKETVLHNIYNTYLIKEIREILNIENDFEMEKLTKSLGLRIADLINLNEISNFMGMNVRKVQQLIHVLEKTFIIQLSNPFYTNKLLELSKSKKLFFRDSGFRNAVIKNFTNQDSRTDTADLYENFIFEETHKKNIETKYWRTKSKAEVDLIIEKNGEIIPVEIKSNLKRSSIQKSLHSFIKKYVPARAFVVSRDYFDFKKINSTDVLFIPFPLFVLIDF